MAFNKRQHLADNIEALRTAFDIAARQERSPQTNIAPTDAEREKLSKYSGFGGLNCVLYPAANPEDIDDKK